MCSRSTRHCNLQLTLAVPADSACAQQQLRPTLAQRARTIPMGQLTEFLRRMKAGVRIAPDKGNRFPGSKNQFGEARGRIKSSHRDVRLARRNVSY
jgi:hypothetical protein